MTTLLLRLAGPMQSWGTQSRFTMRDTGLEPSKSGVIGLLCAALGLGRDTDLQGLATLRMGARVDQPGAMKVDYHTAGGGSLRDGQSYGVRKASGAAGDTVLSNRYYLADADFLVGLEGDDEAQLRRLHDALREPAWQLYLGRKAFVPGVPVHVPEGLRLGERLEEALTRYPWPRLGMDVPPPGRRPDRLRLAVETAAQDGDEVRMDQPHGASFSTRSFLPRRIVNLFREIGSGEGKTPVRQHEKEDADVPITLDHQPAEP